MTTEIIKILYQDVTAGIRMTGGITSEASRYISIKEGYNHVGKINTRIAPCEALFGPMLRGLEEIRTYLMMQYQ